VAAGVEVVLADREPPGVVATAAVVGVVTGLAVVVVVLVPDAAAVGVVEAAAAVVVVVPPAVVVVVLLLDPDACLFESDDFLDADGLDEPQAAAIRPAATTTPAIRSNRPAWGRPRLALDAVESVMLGTDVRPRSSWSVYRWSGDHQVRPTVPFEWAADSRPKPSTMSNTLVTGVSWRL
jgi:hypothetical protein